MTTASGTYAYCGDGNYTLTISCSGKNCTELGKFPGMTCSNVNDVVQCNNGENCVSISNLTSSFLIQQLNTNANVTQTQNVTIIGDQTLIFSGVGSNMSYVNSTTNSTSQRSGACSRQIMRTSDLLRLLVMVIISLFTTLGM